MRKIELEKKISVLSLCTVVKTQWQNYIACKCVTLKVDLNDVI